MDRPFLVLGIGAHLPVEQSHPRERYFYLRKRKNDRYVARNFKRQSERKLSAKDLEVLEFLWTWKAASTQLLKEVAYRAESPWWVYKALRRLKQEKYIQLLPRGRNLDLELWALTRHGFEIVLMDRDDMEQYRYRVHAPAHDYFGTCLQLGDIWQSNVDARFFTEQQLSSLAKWNFLPALRANEEHIPDGVTMIRGALHTVTIGYEVDLNLKEEARYQSTVNYYRDGLKPNLVVWLVRNMWMAEKIWECIRAYSYGETPDDLGKRYAFVLLDDFKQNAWGAIAINRPLKGVSIRKLHANLIQMAGKESAKLAQKSMTEIFFPKFKSPQKSIALAQGATAPPALTPFGSRGINSSADPASSAALIPAAPAPNETLAPQSHLQEGANG